MKDLFEYISGKGSAFSGFTCNGPPKVENSSWKVLGPVDCSTYTARNAKEITEKPVSVLPRRSVYSTSGITDVTEETETKIHIPTPTTPVDTSSATMWIVIIIMLSFIIGCLVVYICMRSRNYKRMLQHTEKRLGQNDEEEEEL
jgi:hypothetical protein